ncbi:MAG: VC0807 family protein [Steroidobacteraceae bacterium]|jgi:hypothetical protein
MRHGQQPTLEQTASTVSRPIIVSLAWDVALNASIPTACYFLSKRFVSSSEVTALIAATIFPILKSIYDLLRQRELNPVTVTVLLGIVTSLFAFFLGGDPRVLLIRESLFTGVFGIFCLISLALPRPVMFYFARHLIAGKDPRRRAEFDARSQERRFLRGHRLITAVWGLAYIGEFAIRTILVFSVPAPVVLAVSPIMMGLVTIAAIVWTFWYRSRLLQSADLKPL